MKKGHSTHKQRNMTNKQDIQTNETNEQGRQTKPRQRKQNRTEQRAINTFRSCADIEHPHTSFFERDSPMQK